jgi:predicted Zn-dependent peptidase
LSPSCLKRSPEAGGLSGKTAGLLSSGLLVLALAGGVLAGQDPGPWKNPPCRNTLDNGLTYIFQKDDSSELTCLLLLIRGGKSAEPAGKSGLAYLTTRLAVEVPDEGKVRDLMLQSTRLSVASFEDCTLINVQCLSSNFEESLKIVSKIIQDPLFSGLRIDAIVENMSHQGKAELDSASNAGHAEFMRAFFGPEGYGGAVWGTEESLKSIRKNDITRFYETYFKASNMVLSIATDLEESVVAGHVRKYLGGMRTGTRTEARPGAIEVPADRRIFREKEAKQSYLGLGFPLPGISPRNYALAYLTEDVVGGGVGSRLWALRFKERLAYDINSTISYPTGEGVLEAYLETSPEKLEAARSSLERVFRDLAAAELTEEDLGTSRNNAGASFLRANETKEARARTAALFEARGLGCEFLEKFLEEIRNVTVAEWNAFIRDVFNLDRSVEVIIGPKEE